jgi:hypothetical protein
MVKVLAWVLGFYRMTLRREVEGRDRPLGR